MHLSDDSLSSDSEDYSSESTEYSSDESELISEESLTESERDRREEAERRKIEELNRYTYDTYATSDTYSPGTVSLIPNDNKQDPDIFGLVRMLDDDHLTQEFLKEYNLRPKGIEQPGDRGRGHPVAGEYFGICSELVPPFNPAKPECRGKVTSTTRKSKKNDRDVLYYYQ
jgi:hypothetical protein